MLLKHCMLAIMELFTGLYTIYLNRETFESFDCKYAMSIDRYVETHDLRAKDNPVWYSLLNDEPAPVDSFGVTRRYPALKPETIEWLNDMVGPENKKWAVHPVRFDECGDFIGSTTEFPIFFKLKRDAMLFKLTWA